MSKVLIETMQLREPDLRTIFWQMNQPLVQILVRKEEASGYTAILMLLQH